jgi:hypothetical protein
VQDIARLCLDLNVPHVVNNAYGLQCSKVTHALNEACRLGRVDVVVQSTDKNFLVPVGGAVIAGPGAMTTPTSPPPPPQPQPPQQGQQGQQGQQLQGQQGQQLQGQRGGKPGPGLVLQVCKMYPGRAGSAPVQVGGVCGCGVIGVDGGASLSVWCLPFRF